MKTIWGERLESSNVLQEYPRPQMVRDSYINLNGLWSYAVTKADAKPERWDGEILVPFSPECELSGVKRTLRADQTLWYHREVVIPYGFFRGRIILHFGAVDQQAELFINGVSACVHTGGYLPFEADITELLSEIIKNEASGRETSFLLTVAVKDDTDASYHARGKQKTKKGGIWYTPQSGIWQTVWLESVPEEHIEKLYITPKYDDSAVELTICSNSQRSCTARIGGIVAQVPANEPTRISLLGFTSWTPERPHLYELKLQMGEDVVQSYFAMRKFEISEDKEGKKRFFLNGKPYFHNGLLDQGYWPDGLYTAPSDEAMIFDIQTAKDMGFNMLRKHIKIEPLRWYYHCDRLGMLVWQDAVNGGGKYRMTTVTAPVLTGKHKKDDDYAGFAREDERGREEFIQELDEMTDTLYNCACIALWTIFNEGWGQFDAEKAYLRLREKDASRPIDHASGWHDQGIGDIKSHHVYFKPFVYRDDEEGRTVILSEFGGYRYRIPEHSLPVRAFGYKTCKTEEELCTSYTALYEEQIIPAMKKGLAAAVYTQLSDVEGECNGLISYDRKIIKLSAETLLRLNKQLTL